MVKKVFLWLLVFPLLTLITMESLFGWSQTLTLKAALAAPEMSNSHAVILVNDGQESRSFLRRFALLYHHDLVCGLTDKQYQAFKLLYQVDEKNLIVSGQKVPIVTVRGKRLTMGALYGILRSTSEPLPACIIPRQQRIFYFLLPLSVS